MKGFPNVLNLILDFEPTIPRASARQTRQTPVFRRRRLQTAGCAILRFLRLHPLKTLVVFDIFCVIPQGFTVDGEHDSADERDSIVNKCVEVVGQGKSDSDSLEGFVMKDMLVQNCG